MNKLFGVLAVALLASAVPDSASAQCGAVCTRFVKETGEVGGHGCVSALNNDSCIATVRRCTVSRCANALLTTPEGRVVGQLACGAAAGESGRSIAAALRLPAELFAEITRRMEMAAGDAPPLPAGSA